MATAKDLQRELDEIRREIDELREGALDIEEVLDRSGRLGFLRAPNAWLLRRGLEARIQTLRVRYSVVHNCYLAVKRDEERAPLKIR